jgi:hypothetical protein
MSSTGAANTNCAAVFNNQAAPVELALAAMRVASLNVSLKPVVNVLLEAEKAKQDFEISFMIKEFRGDPFKVSGRIIKSVNEYMFTIRNEDGKRVEFSYQVVVPDSIELQHKPLPRHAPPLSKELHLPSEIARADDVNYFIHGTYLPHLSSILQAGELSPRGAFGGKAPEVGSRGEKGVYLSAVGKNKRGEKFPEPGHYSTPYHLFLVFRPTVLDHNEFHMSRRTPYGKFTEDSALSYDLDKLHQILWELSNGFLTANEEVFPDAVSLRDLTAIWVDASVRRDVIKILKKAGYVPPGDISIEQFVISQVTWP